MGATPVKSVSCGPTARLRFILFQSLRIQLIGSRAIAMGCGRKKNKSRLRVSAPPNSMPRVPVERSSACPNAAVVV